MEHSVFERQGQLTDRIVSPGAYNLIIGLTLLWGFLINAWMVGNISVEWIRSINSWVFFGGYFASCLLGVYLFSRSSHPAVSFIGYNLVVVPFGLVVNLVVSRYSPELVQQAIRITALVTVAMMVLGTLFPAFFQRIASALCIALLLVIVVELVEIFVFGVHHGILHWIVVLIFCGYIGYDWGRANQIPKTVDNAIDSAAALYMDIINLFLRILRILGRK
ncbi:MAG TPA: Bax inhibitor-1 family protein [Pseudomonas sp.]|nr:Bax inhibitor-1 family protein [Pseudomonas sp.]